MTAQPAPTALTPGFTMVPNWLRDMKLSYAAQSLYRNLLQASWQDGCCYVGHDTLMEWMGCSRASVKRYLSELSTRGLIKSERRGNRATNCYSIVAHTSLRSHALAQSDSSPVNRRTLSVVPSDSSPVNRVIAQQRASDSSPVSRPIKDDENTGTKTHYQDSEILVAAPPLVPPAGLFDSIINDEATASAAPAPAPRPQPTPQPPAIQGPRKPTPLPPAAQTSKPASKTLAETDPQRAADRDALVVYWETLTGQQRNAGTLRSVAVLLQTHSADALRGTIDALWAVQSADGSHFWRKGNMWWRTIGSSVAAFQRGDLTPKALRSSAINAQEREIMRYYNPASPTMEQMRIARRWTAEGRL